MSYVPQWQKSGNEFTKVNLFKKIERLKIKASNIGGDIQPYDPFHKTIIIIHTYIHTYIKHK